MWRSSCYMRCPFCSSPPEDAAATAAVHDTLKPKILRFFALFMICGEGGCHVMPHGWLP